MQITVNVPDELADEVLAAFTPPTPDGEEPAEPAVSHVEAQLLTIIAGRVATARAEKVRQEARETVKAAQRDAIGAVSEAFGVDLPVRERPAEQLRAGR